jgi:tryptophanyl-tRNA synthetase
VLEAQVICIWATTLVRLKILSKCNMNIIATFLLPIIIRLLHTPHPDNLLANERQVVIEYLACGLDPEVCTLYLQSDIPQTAELYLFLNMMAYLGELERVTTFKDKARTQPDNINAGLLTYPTLMAADVLIHKGIKVPVGKDQEQHLEMMRTFGNRFNRLYNVDYFPEPQAFSFSSELVKVPGLDGSGKMGKIGG